MEQLFFGRGEFSWIFYSYVKLIAEGYIDEGVNQQKCWFLPQPSQVGTTIQIMEVWRAKSQKMSYRQEF